MSIDHHVDTTVKALGVGGASAWGFGWAASVDWIAAIGAAVLVATAITNFIFKKKADRRAQEKHDLEMQRLRKEGGA